MAKERAKQKNKAAVTGGGTTGGSMGGSIAGSMAAVSNPGEADAWCSATPDGCCIRLQIQPRASRSAVMGPFGEPPRLKIRVAAPPVDGEANEELLQFLRKKLRLPLNQMHIVRGETSKQKDILITGLTKSEVCARLR